MCVFEGSDSNKKFSHLFRGFLKKASFFSSRSVGRSIGRGTRRVEVKKLFTFLPLLRPFDVFVSESAKRAILAIFFPSFLPSPAFEEQLMVRKQRLSKGATNERTERERERREPTTSLRTSYSCFLAALKEKEGDEKGECKTWGR